MPEPAVRQQQQETTGQRRGLRVALLLAVLTLGEYLVAVAIGSTAVLVILLAAFALVKAGLIVTYFMHLPEAWRGEGVRA